MSVEVITVSSKGQIALPAGMRKRMSINQGDKFAAYEDGNVIMLKPLKIPSEEEFKMWLEEASDRASTSGLKEAQVSDIIKEYRAEKRAKKQEDK